MNRNDGRKEGGDVAKGMCKKLPLWARPWQMECTLYRGATRQLSLGSFFKVNLAKITIQLILWLAVCEMFFRKSNCVENKKQETAFMGPTFVKVFIK